VEMHTDCQAFSSETTILRISLATMQLQGALTSVEYCEPFPAENFMVRRWY